MDKEITDAQKMFIFENGLEERISKIEKRLIEQQMILDNISKKIDLQWNTY